MTKSDPDQHSTDDELREHPPGPADHGGHGGMATRENDVDDEDTDGRS